MSTRTEMSDGSAVRVSKCKRCGGPLSPPQEFGELRELLRRCSECAARFASSAGPRTPVRVDAASGRLAVATVRPLSWWERIWRRGA